MFTTTQLEAIRTAALERVARYSAKPLTLGPAYAVAFEREQCARLVSEFRCLAIDCLLLLDRPYHDVADEDATDALASIEQMLDAWPELDAVAIANTEAARAHLASLSNERRTQLDREFSK
jgi:hypothetical protein